MTDMAIKVIALLSTFAGRACLAAAVAIAALTPPLAPANAAPAEERTPAGASLHFNEEDSTLYIDWSAPILAGMADYLRTALGKYGTLSHRVVLFLNSAGGQVEEGDSVIQILNEAKQTHRLITQVLEGNLCASMCIPIVLQGDDLLLHGQATGSSMKPPDREQMARNEQI
jgi:membrane-bound ClpP family serine protease